LGLDQKLQRARILLSSINANLQILTILNTSFALTWAAVLSVAFLPPVPVAVVAFAAALIWLITLGILAHRLGRSWVVWSGGTIVTDPIGMVVVRVLMLRLA